MTNNLSETEKVIIFAMYLGCETHLKDPAIDSEIKKLIAVSYECALISFINTPDYKEGERWYFTDQVKLLLSSLKDISDEHAIEISKAAGLIELSFGRQGMIDFGRNMARYFENNIHFSHPHIDPLDIVNMVDKFRELKYAVPYKGQSLFDLGVAIDKNKK